jgi:formate hydrogenlyase subunit 3/multisubunit Na+/H+ antiporter MnhD subunit
MRAHPPEGFRATAMFALTLLAVALPGGALPGGGVLGAYVVARVVFDLAGPAQPAWWGAVPALLGAGGACLAAATAFRAADIRTVAAAAAMVPGGLAAMAIGLALAARAADLAPLAALALGAMLLLTIAQALGGTLLALVAQAAETGAGTRRLDRLGGLLRGMPMTGVCALVAAASLAALPPSAGFAAVWTLVQALIGTARGGGVGWQGLAALAALAAAGAVALSALAVMRLIGIAFLGRPRTPRAAAAQEAPVAARAAMLSLAALASAAGMFPGALLALAAPALRALLGVDLADRAGWFDMAPSVGAPGLRAAALAVLLVAATLGTLWAQKLRAPIGHRAGAAWVGGGAPPPPWLPFGDPATQIGPAGFAEPVGSLLAAATPRVGRRLRKPLQWWRAGVARADAALRPSPRVSLAALAIVAALLLIAVLAVQA